MNSPRECQDLLRLYFITDEEKEKQEKLLFLVGRVFRQDIKNEYCSSDNVINDGLNNGQKKGAVTFSQREWEEKRRGKATRNPGGQHVKMSFAQHYILMTNLWLWDAR